jgi:hypothetical protein
VDFKSFTYLSFSILNHVRYEKSNFRFGVYERRCTQLQEDYNHETVDTTTKYTITAASDGQGAIDPPGVNTVTAGSNWTYNINPNANYGILSLSIDGVAIVPAPGSYTFSNVDANHTIKATFSAIATIKVVVTNGVSVVSNPPLLGGSVSLIFSPNATFHTDSLYVNVTFIKLLHGAVS